MVVACGRGVFRCLGPFLVETCALVEAGVGLERLDKVMKSYGLPVGPITLADEVGVMVSTVKVQRRARFSMREYAASPSYDRIPQRRLFCSIRMVRTHPARRLVMVQPPNYACVLDYCSLSFSCFLGVFSVIATVL